MERTRAVLSPVRRFGGWSLAAAFTLPLLVAGASVISRGGAGSPRTAAVLLGGREFWLEVADTPSERARGLSGRESIAEDGGMLFRFDRPGRYVFWMKGMRFPIDIVWVGGGTILEVSANAAPPVEGTPESEIQLGGGNPGASRPKGFPPSDARFARCRGLGQGAPDSLPWCLGAGNESPLLGPIVTLRQDRRES